MANTKRVGRIVGDPTVGLCERICIEVPQVLDACRENVSNQSFTLALTDISAQAVPPFTYVSAVSAGDAVFTTECIEYAENGKSCVEGTVDIPITVTFTDAYARPYTGKGNLRLRGTFLLALPLRSLTPYRLEVFAAFNSISGNFLNENTVSVSGCYLFVLKVIATTDILVPSYGYAEFPACETCTDDICRGITSAALFPAFRR